jgi:putative flippase GtrA
VKRQVFFFLAVGCAAAFTHMSVVVFLVEAFGWPAAMSNIAAFCVAFVVSFNGHSRLTFPQPSDLRAEACRRFIVIALTGFIVNQLTYSYALTLFGPRLYLPILFVVLPCVAVFTFTMSRCWAFALREKTA